MRKFAGKLAAAGVRAAIVVCLLAPGIVRGETGEEIFQTRCRACHTVGAGKLVGPDLKGVSERRAAEWIVKFVQSSQTLVKAGDQTAVELFNEFKIPMPDQPLTEAQVAAVIEYTRAAGGSGVPAAAPAAIPPATEAQIALGQSLFIGQTRLANSGPSCNSCHDVSHDAIISGGVLARELTTVFTRLGGQGVRAILGSPPFPVMQKAYEERPLLPDEVAALVGFLEKTNSDQKNHMPRDTGLKLAAGGTVGTVFLLGFYSLLWNRRKRESVNQAIYDRQIKSR